MVENAVFLRRFIENLDYLQNVPLTADKFAEFASNLGLKITKKNLEELEEQQLLFPIMRLEKPAFDSETIIFKDKDGQEKWRYAKDKPIEGEQVIGTGSVRQYSYYGFHERDKDHLMALLDEGYLYDPQDKEFQPWETFRRERLENGDEKIVSLYSTYQLHWLCFLRKNLKLEIDFTRVPISKFKLENLERQVDELQKKISWLREQRKKYEHKCRLMMCLQSVYAPNGRSGAKHIQLQSDVLAWQKKRASFNLENTLDFLEMPLEDVAVLYVEFCVEMRNLLNVAMFERGVIQLWKNMNWDIKSHSVEGPTRRGVEYMQWALTLKRALSDSLGRDVLDLDEVSRWKPQEVISVDPTTLDYEDSWKMDNNRRAARNAELFDASENKSYYFHTYKRLFYLANTLGTDYQPRVMVFVEGQTEEIAMRKLFEWRLGLPEHHGIEFFNINGVSNFFGDATKFDTQDGSGTKKLVSNFHYLISYNLNQWQIIPFVVADDEGGMGKAILGDLSISYQGESHAMPKTWKFVWGIDDYDKPFGGNSFELANFTNAEIVQALKEVLNITVADADVELLRNAKQGIKHIQSGRYKTVIKGQNKVELGKKLIELLIANFQPGDDSKVHKRPILKIFDMIMKLGALNHPPISRMGEVQNQHEIMRALKGLRTGPPHPITGHRT